MNEIERSDRSQEPQQNHAPCRILSLDGGGAKGFYTLGVLKGLEAMLGRPLFECFELIFGTSTGAIIASLLALGKSVDDVHALYQKHVPDVMRAGSARVPIRRSSRKAKSKALEALATNVFKDTRFEKLKTGLGIVATRWDFERPMIFKRSIAQAHGQKGTFEPGFGCTISDAVQASCAAYPFFDRKTVTTGSGDKVELIDGGYCANNPTLYAIADALMALKRDAADLRVVSVGVGSYPEPKRGILRRTISRLEAVQLLQKTLDINTSSMEQLRVVLFKHIATVRISDTFEKPEMATDLMEHNLTKLNLLYQRGRDSFAKQEEALRQLLGSGSEGRNGDS